MIILKSWKKVLEMFEMLCSCSKEKNNTFYYEKSLYVLNSIYRFQVNDLLIPTKHVRQGLIFLLYLWKKKEKKIGGVICPSSQSYALNELRFEHKPCGPKACVINVEKNHKHIFYVDRCASKILFLYLSTL